MYKPHNELIKIRFQESRLCIRHLTLGHNKYLNRLRRMIYVAFENSQSKFISLTLGCIKFLSVCAGARALLRQKRVFGYLALIRFMKQFDDNAFLKENNTSSLLFSRIWKCGNYRLINKHLRGKPSEPTHYATTLKIYRLWFCCVHCSVAWAVHDFVTFTNHVSV